MKKQSFLFILSLFLISCGSNMYNINGIIADKKFNGKMIYLTDLNTNQKIDSTTVVDGAFNFTGSSEIKTIFSVVIPRTSYYTVVIPENADITIKLSERSEVTSNGLNSELAKIQSLEFKTMKLAETLFGKYDEEDVIEIISNILYNNKIGSLTQLSQEDSLIVNEYFQDVLKTNEVRQAILESNKDNMLGVYCVYWIYDFYEQGPGLPPLALAESLLDIVPLAREFSPIMKSYNMLKAIHSTSPGKEFVDFSGENIDGSPAKLSDYVGKGKYVLVDFWASWCAPCTKEIPNIKFLYENYPELVILGVNVWDKKDSFHKYIEDKELRWPMLYASNGEIATSLYGITSIPTIILFDPQGIIVDRNLRGSSMKERIAEIFNK